MLGVEGEVAQVHVASEGRVNLLAQVKGVAPAQVNLICRGKGGCGVKGGKEDEEEG